MSTKSGLCVGCVHTETNETEREEDKFRKSSSFFAGIKVQILGKWSLYLVLNIEVRERMLEKNDTGRKEV